MTAPEDHSAWKRLGELLESRRVELDPAYMNLTRFCEETGIDYRLAWDIEHHRRTNYRRPTLTAIEVAYEWRPGSIRKVLDGGEPELSQMDPQRRDALRAARRALHDGQSGRRNGTTGLAGGPA